MLLKKSFFPLLESFFILYTTKAIKQCVAGSQIILAQKFCTFIVCARGNLQFLARGPEQNFIYVYILRLAHGEDDGPNK